MRNEKYEETFSVFKIVLKMMLVFEIKVRKVKKAERNKDTNHSNVMVYMVTQS